MKLIIMIPDSFSHPFLIIRCYDEAELEGVDDFKPSLWFEWCDDFVCLVGKHSISCISLLGCMLRVLYS